MKSNRTKVESNAINEIRRIVDKSERLLPNPSFGDRGISTDGYIQLFKNEDVDKGENLLRQIPIQIKGRTDKTKKLVRINSNKNTEKIEVKDIQNYYRQGGAIFFFVYFDKDYEKHAVFYSVLMPVKCKRYLEISSNSNLKEVPVSFEKLEENGTKIYELCAQFHEEQKKQGFGDGTLMEHVVSWKDIKGETTLTATAVGANSTLEVLKRAVRGDIHLYVKEGAFSVPLEWIDNGRLLKCIHYEHPVMINEEKYYDFIDVEIDMESQSHRLILGKTIFCDVEKASLTFVKDNRTFSDLAKASRFLIALSKYKSLKAGEMSLQLSNLDFNNASMGEFSRHIEICEILDKIGIDANQIINKENDIKLRKQLLLLWEIANHLKDGFFKDKFTHFDWSLCGKKYPLVIVLNDGKEKNDIYSLLFSSIYQTYCGSEDGNVFPVPTFAFPTFDVMKNLYTYDIRTIEEQIERTPINEATKEYVNMGALKLISIFDTTGDTKILSLADKMLEALLDNTELEKYLVINRMQVLKRMNRIGEEERSLLKELSECGLTVFEFAANVLLDERNIAIEKYGSLETKELNELDGMPIMTMFNRMQ